MNGLTKFLVDSILNEDKVPGKTALFGGGFKPPTKGHLEVVTQGLKDNPEVDEVYIFVGSGVRNNISQEEAIKIWEMFKPFISVKSTIIKAGSPLKDMKRFIEDMEDKPYVFIGARPDNEEDEKDVAERSKFFEKYGGIPKRVNTSDSAISGTRARNAAKTDNKQELFSYFPEGLTDTQKEEIYDMLRSVVKEQVNFKSLEQQLDNMFAELDIDVAFTTHFKERVLERGLTEDDILELAEKIIDAYPDQLDFLNQGQNIVMSHLSRLIDIAAVNTGYGDDYLKDLVFKTAYKRKDKSEPEFRTNASSPRLAVNENASYSKDIDILEKLAQLTQHMIDKGYNIEPLPGLELINGDTENARDFFGKTAYYDPNTQTIVLYTEGRHPKDIARSYAHEMIHHMQNLEGRLGNITTTNTQEDDHLNDIEAEANLKGTMTFRNWTDSLTENQEPDRVKFIKYLEKLIK